MPSMTPMPISRRRLLTGALATTAIIPLRNSLGFWDPAGASDVSAPGRKLTRLERNALIYGNYEPTAYTTGILPGTTLTAYNSTSVNTFTLPSALNSAAIAAGWYSYQGGMALKDKLIYGDMRPLWILQVGTTVAQLSQDGLACHNLPFLLHGTTP